MQSLGADNSGEVLQSLTSRGEERGGFQNQEKVWKGLREELELTPSDPCVHRLGEYIPQVTFLSTYTPVSR